MYVTHGIISFMALWSVSLLSAYDVSRSLATEGAFVTIYMCMVRLQTPLQNLAGKYGTLQSHFVGAERMLELVAAKSEVTDKKNARNLRVMAGEIRFINVTFSYDTRRTVLENFSLLVRPGTTVAFVGESGGGKSTIFDLMWRFYNVIEGNIHIDGQDIKDVKVRSLRENIGIVPQVIDH